MNKQIIYYYYEKLQISTVTADCINFIPLIIFENSYLSLYILRDMIVKKYSLHFGQLPSQKYTSSYPNFYNNSVK